MKAYYDNMKTQSQSQIQDLANPLNQLNLQMLFARASTVQEYKTSTEFTNIIDKEFLKSVAKVKAMMKSHYP